MSRNNGRFLALFTLAVGVVCLAYSAVTADPAANQGCTNVCQMKQWFIVTTSLNAIQLTPAYCQFCVDGGCLLVPNTDPPNCVPVSGKDTGIAIYFKKGKALCPLPDPKQAYHTEAQSTTGIPDDLQTITTTLCIKTK